MLVHKPSAQSVSDNESTTANDTKRKVNAVDDNNLKVPLTKKSRLRITRSGSSVSNKEDELSDNENDELDESEVEIPNIEPSDVCINLGDGEDDDGSTSGGGKKGTNTSSSKLNIVASTRSTRHSAMQQQQALSV